MSHKISKQKSLPLELEKSIAQLGERIRIARKRRALTMDEMASRMFVTRKTLARLEKGSPGISLGVFATALWVLGLEKEFFEIALPEKDMIGLFHEKKRLPERVRKSTKNDELDF